MLKRSHQAEEMARPNDVAVTVEDTLMSLASQLEPDGGMPGKSSADRAARTIAAVLAFLSAGHTPSEGAFRSHVARLVEFLKSPLAVSERERELIGRVIQAVSAGTAPEGSWAELTDNPGGLWKAVEKALGSE